MKTVPDHIVKLAEKICLKSEMNQQMSAIIFNNSGRVINIGYNRRIIKSRNPTTIYKYRIPYISVHAEVDCLAGLNFSDTIGNYIYIHRLQWGHDFSAVEIAAVFRPQQMPKN